MLKIKALPKSSVSIIQIQAHCNVHCNIFQYFESVQPHSLPTLPPKIHRETFQVYKQEIKAISAASLFQQYIFKGTKFQATPYIYILFNISVLNSLLNGNCHFHHFVFYKFRSSQAYQVIYFTKDNIIFHNAPWIFQVTHIFILFPLIKTSHRMFIFETAFESCITQPNWTASWQQEILILNHKIGIRICYKSCSWFHEDSGLKRLDFLFFLFLENFITRYNCKM